MPVIFPRMTKSSPIANASLVFTDGSSNGQAAFSIDKKVAQISTCYRSAHLVELQAIIEVFKTLPNISFNLYTDSSYLAHSVPQLKFVPFIKPTTNTAPLFSILQKLIHDRNCPFFIGHIRAHSGLPGPLSQGNNFVDQVTQFIGLTQDSMLDPLAQARQAHNLHHLNSQTLKV